MNIHQLNIKCKECSLKQCFIKKYCSTDEQHLVNRFKSTLIYKKGQQIIHEGSLFVGIYYIFSGKVKIFIEGINYKKQIIYFLKPGDFLGYEDTENTNKTVYHVSATTIEDSVICFIEKDVFLKVLISNPDFSFQLLKCYLRKLQTNEIRLKKMAQMNVREKVADALLTMYETFGMDENGVINVELKRMEIASIVDTSPELVTRLFHEFKRDKVIDFEERRNKITIFCLEKLKKEANVTV